MATLGLKIALLEENFFVEGDPFNKGKLNSSIKSIKRLGYFKSVNYKLQDTNIL